MTDTAEKANRWDETRREQFSSLTSLVLTLATALVAFQTSLFVGNNGAWAPGQWLALFSLLLLVGSIACGLWCAWSRLNDFRLTAQIARGGSDVSAQRKQADSKGETSWTLLKWQLGLFFFGTLLVGGRILF